MPTVISEEPGDAQTESIDRDEPASCAGNHAYRIGVHAYNASANTLSDEEEPEAQAETEIDRADDAEIERADASDIGIVAKQANPQHGTQGDNHPDRTAQHCGGGRADPGNLAGAASRR